MYRYLGCGTGNLTLIISKNEVFAATSIVTLCTSVLKSRACIARAPHLPHPVKSMITRDAVKCAHFNNRRRI